jgi:uncharacterized protein GlcG (DUF336 family)
MTQDTSTASVTQLSISEAAARELGAAAVRHADELGKPIAVAVVDAAGGLKHLGRMDGVSTLAADIAADKAWTSVAFGLATHDVNAFLSQDAGAAPLAHRPRLTAVGGGYPLLENGTLIGALGISGGHYSEDQQIAEQAIAELGLGPAE